MQLDIGVEREFSADELNKFQETLVAEGLHLTTPVQMGTGDWENTIRIQFKNPEGYGALPAAPIAIIVLALGAVGLSGMLGWRLSDVIRDYFPAILISAVGIGVLWLALSYKERKRA